MAISQTTVQFISQLLRVLPDFIRAGKDVSSLLNEAQQVLNSGQDPTPAQVQAQDQRIAELRNELHRP